MSEEHAEIARLLARNVFADETPTKIHAVEAALAAAEERGRRRGVEERDELRALLREVETTLAGRREIEGASPATVSAIAAKLATYAVHHPALAPRDSGPIGTCAKFWHPGRGHEPHARREAVGDLSAVHADHVNDSGCLNWKPRDSGKEK